jgi:hypothetical protein
VASPPPGLSTMTTLTCLMGACHFFSCLGPYIWVAISSYFCVMAPKTNVGQKANVGQNASVFVLAVVVGFLKLANHGELEAALLKHFSLVCKRTYFGSAASNLPWLARPILVPTELKGNIFQGARNILEDGQVVWNGLYFRRTSFGVDEPSLCSLQYRQHPAPRRLALSQSM